MKSNECDVSKEISQLLKINSRSKRKKQGWVSGKVTRAYQSYFSLLKTCHAIVYFFFYRANPNLKTLGDERVKGGANTHLSSLPLTPSALHYLTQKIAGSRHRPGRQKIQYIIWNASEDLGSWLWLYIWCFVVVSFNEENSEQLYNISRLVPVSTFHSITKTYRSWT